MINLLPPQQIKEETYERKYRLFLILGVLIVVFLIVLSLVLLAIRVQISGEFQGGKIFVSQQIEDYENEILAVNKDLQNLNSFYNKSRSFTEIIEEISRLIPPEIRLKSLYFSFSEKSKNFSVALEGLSPARESLFQLKRNLESSANFESINFPPSNWVKPEDIEFNITFIIKI